MKIRIFIVIVIACLIFRPGPVGSQTKPRFVTIGSGDATGVYFPIGLAIAKMMNDKRQEYGIRATVECTQGSVYNIDAITAGNLEFGLVQSDKQYQAVNGMAEWRNRGPQPGLHSVFSLHHEFITLVAAADAEIQTLADLEGKRVNLGNQGSGQHKNAIDALSAAGLSPAKDIIATKVNTPEALDLLQANRIDAFFCTLGQPSEILIAATTGKRPVRFVPVSGPGIDRLVRDKNYYVKDRILAEKFYPGAVGPKEVQTISVVATLCTSSKVSDEVVYSIVKEVITNFEDLRNTHPALSNWSLKGLLTGLSAPIHPGAKKFFMEVE